MITPQEARPELARDLALPRLYLKREDLHPLGSHKGRSIPVMIDTYAARGEKKFSISSSGNAALAGARYIKGKNDAGANISLDIFIGQNIPEEKKSPLTSLADGKIKVFEKERPLQSLLEAMKLGARSLRQSTDDTALLGYETLAEELSGTPDLNAVFIATSSGTTAQAIGEYFLKKGIKAEIHIVQTSSCHPMAAVFDTEPRAQEVSIARAISDKVAHRREQVMSTVSRTNGSGWIVSNEEIAFAQEKLKSIGITASPNGALALAGLMRARSQGRKFKGAVVCIIGGK